MGTDVVAVVGAVVAVVSFAISFVSYVSQSSRHRKQFDICLIARLFNFRLIGSDCFRGVCLAESEGRNQSRRDWK